MAAEVEIAPPAGTDLEVLFSLAKSTFGDVPGWSDERVLETLGRDLVFLMARGVHRHCRLLECLLGASKKMMTDTLRALERDGLVARRIYAEVPLRVEYSLTPLGWATTDLLMTLAEWHEAHGGAVRDARRSYRAEPGDRHERPLPHRLAAAG